jgi:hypothetical protein
MTKDAPNLVEVNTGCLMNVMRFLRSQMPVEDMPAFLDHARQCRECHDYIEIISTLMANRKEILKQLEKGAFHER